MRAIALSMVLMLTVTGCKVFAPGPVTDQPHSDHPQGTAIGASFPGVNQGTQTTTATASTDR